MAVDPAPYYQDIPAARPRFGLIAFKDIRPTADPPYLVKGLVPREGLTVEWGAPKSGKSFWAFDLAMSVALGKDYRGRRTQQGPVVYVACEGATGLRARIEAYRQHHGIDPQEAVPFYLVPHALDLTTDATALIKAIQQALDDHRPALVVLDTLNRSLAGSENDPADMAAYIKAVDTIRETFACAVLVVHHCGIEGSRPRGHTSLTGAADAQLSVKRSTGGVVTTTVEWMKDGPEGDTLYSRLEVVEVGQDQDGDPITSCVVVPAEASSSARAVRLTPKNRQALDKLFDCLNDLGNTAPASNHIPQSVTVVTLDQWRDYLERSSVINKDGNPREQFRRLKDGLREKQAIGIWDDWVWDARP